MKMFYINVFLSFKWKTFAKNQKAEITNLYVNMFVFVLFCFAF